MPDKVPEKSHQRHGRQGYCEQGYKFNNQILSCYEWNDPFHFPTFCYISRI